MRPGCYDPKARLDDMDADGVWAQVNFPDFCRFAGHRFVVCADKALATLCIQAYNDFVLDEWCAADPDRLVPLGLVPLWDVEAAAAEVRRIAFSEGGGGWVPYLLEQAEDIFHSYRVQIRGQRAPREVFAEHMYVCILRDNTALSSIGVIPEDNIMWESDYPHDSTLFPESRRLLEESMRDVPDAVARKIAETNARRVFRI